MVNVVVTGGGGFLGTRLARRLLAAGELDLAGDGPRPIDRLTLIDQVPAPADLAGDQRVTAVQGDLAELLDAGPGPLDAGPGPLDAGPGPPAAGPGPLAAADLIFHLAAVVSGECEADFDLGLRANLRATEALLAASRALGTRPVLVFSSSIAVFGDSPDHRLPAVIDDQTLASPQSSYGTQKVMAEYLLADYTRKGFLRGRTMRLATVSVRPGRPNAAASGFLSGIIREPLAGQRAICPVDARTQVALASPDRAVDALLCAATAADQAWGGNSAVNMPSLTITVADMVAALERTAGPAASALIDWVPDPAAARLVASWPARFRTDRAARLGLAPDPDYDTVIAMHLAQTKT